MTPRRIVHTLIVMVAGVVGLALLPPAAGAQTPVGAEGAEEQMILWPLVTDGIEHRRVPYPRQAGPVQVLADTPVVFDVRRATVSFWPITREYLSDFGDSAEEQFAAGDLEIVDASGDVTVVEQETFIEWRPDGVTGANSQILVGAEARQQYRTYVTEARAASDQAQEYSAAVATQQAEARAWARQAARSPDNPPPAPEFEELVPPKPYRAYATKPRNAAVTTLPAGRYDIRLRGEDGEIIAGSEREVISFGPLGQGVGYDVRPELRWTQPVGSYDPADAVYTTGNQALYLSPVPVEQYNAARFARLFQPQLLDAPDPTATIWVPRVRTGSEDFGNLTVTRDGEQIQDVEETPYRVVQLPTQSPGYRIEESQGGRTAEGLEDSADFSAMMLPGGLKGTAELSLINDDSQVPGSRRDLRHFKLANDALLFLPATLPLAIAFALGAGPRRRRRRSR